MNILYILKNIPDINLYFNIEDLQKIEICNKGLNKIYKNFLYNFILYSKFNIITDNLCSLKHIYFGMKLSNDNIYKFKSEKLTFQVNFFNEYDLKIIKDYYKWWDKYLSIFFNYNRYTNYFIYKNDLNNYNFKKDFIYFEINYLNENCFSVGFATKLSFFHLLDTKLLLGSIKESVGLNLNNGLIYNQGIKEDFDNKEDFDLDLYFNLNDTIGCGYDLKNKMIFFTKNGKKYASLDFHIKNIIFPCIIYDSKIMIDINYGDEKFYYIL